MMKGGEWENKKKEENRRIRIMRKGGEWENKKNEERRIGEENVKRRRIGE